MIKARPCWNCGNDIYYQLGNGWLKCKQCRKMTSLTNNTSLNNLKLSNEKLSKIVECICKDPSISIHCICDETGVSFVTGQKRKQLITAAIIDTNSRDPQVILKRLLEPDILSSVVATMKGLSDSDVINIREMSKDGISTKKISDVFNIDNSNCRKIIKGKLYKYLPI